MPDLPGNLGLFVNIVALLLLIVGVVRRHERSKTILVRHGYLSILALGLMLGTVFVAMIPTVVSDTIAGLSTLQLWVIVTKSTLGIIGIVMAFICIIPWINTPVEQMACIKAKKWMMPTLIIWTVSVIFGAIIHLAGIT